MTRSPAIPRLHRVQVAELVGAAIVIGSLGGVRLRCMLRALIPRPSCLQRAFCERDFLGIGRAGSDGGGAWLDSGNSNCANLTYYTLVSVARATNAGENS